MVFFTALWLPIVLSAVAVFFASFIMHMVLPYHRNDYRQLPDEDKILTALRAASITRGLYVFPYCTHKDMKSPAVIEKQKLGPVGFMTIIPNGPPAMPKLLTQWFVFCLLIGFAAACIAYLAIPFGRHHRAAFHVVGIAAFLAYGLANLSSGIWKGQKWSTTIKEVIDGLVYALLTAATFAWLWPQ
jgi:hypothetical protein